MTWALTWIGVAWVVGAVSEDLMAKRMVLGLGCFLLAWVYWRVTEPPRRD